MRVLAVGMVGVTLCVGVVACGGGETTSTTTASPAASGQAAAKTVVFKAPTKPSFEVQPGAATGYVDFAKAEGKEVIVIGWAASGDLRTPSDEATGVVDGRAVAETKPSIPRPDVAEANGSKGVEDSGFEIRIPRSALDCSAPAGGLTVFGSSKGAGSRLPYVAHSDEVIDEAC